MATKIVTKNSSTGGSAPSASDLVQGELAVNVTDGRLYTENASAAIVELGVNPTAEIQANAGVAFPTTQKAEFRDSAIYINSSADGQLDIVADTEIQIAATTIDVNGNADVSGTLGVTGVLTANGGAVFNEASADVDFRVESDGNANMLFVDGGNNRVGIGTSSPIGNMQVNGTNNGDVLYITSSDVEDDRGLMFSNSSNGLIWDLDAKGASSAFGQLTFSTNGAERVRVDSAGHAIIGGGITLGNGQTYAAANTISDYEQGTWLPSVGSSSGTQPSLTYTSRTGFYTKIGNIVHVSGEFALNGMTDGTNGQFLIRDLPFNVGRVFAGSHTGHQITAALGGFQLSNFSTNRMGLLGQGASGGSWAWIFINDVLNNVSAMRFSATYEVA